MNTKQKVKLINDLIEENEEVTIKQYLEILAEIEQIELAA